MNSTNNNSTPPNRLTPAQINQVVDGVMNTQSPLSATPQSMPTALTPAKIEALMSRALASPEIREMSAFFRPADAAVDPGAQDLIPLANVISQVSRQGPEAFSITVMYAAWALATFARLRPSTTANTPAPGEND